ncbi:MAG: transposase [Acidobacteriota bacterium]
MEYKQYYRRKLPHIHSPGAVLFVTFRLAGSIPKTVIEKWKQEKIWLEKESGRIQKLSESENITNNQKEDLLNFHRRWFAKFEDVLHQEESNIVWLKDEMVAQIIADSLKYRDGKVYHLKAFCIMSNHVHVVFKPLLDEKSLKEVEGSSPLKFVSSEPALAEIMQSLKGYTAHEANKILNRSGKFWEEESYDHEVRNEEELSRIVKYVLNNPVKAGLVKDWRDWKWNWLRDS